MEIIDKPFLKSPLPDNIGKLLMISQVQIEGCDQIIQAKLYDGMVVIGHEYFMCTFDVQFQSSEDYIQFTHEGNTQTYCLPLSDGIKWTDFLKQQINRKGFHEYFRPLKKIGKGNFASVYLVECIQTKHKFAVKAFSKEAAYSEENGKQCLMKEIEIMRKLKHPNNMHLYEVYESDNSLYIVFQLLEGGQLFDKIKTNQITSKQICQIIHCILLGLKEMHSKNIMHRDLKPENILIRNDCECVIADFGLAQFCDEENYLFARCGTPGYVAPQVINIRDMQTKYTAVCDIFSLGLIFHLLLFGKSIFQGKNYNDILTQNRACNFDLNNTEYRSLPCITLDLLQKMLKVNPEERITSEQALLHPYFSAMHEEVNTPRHCLECPETPIKIKLKKDSCLDFKMGKQNSLTGKTETLGTLQSSKQSQLSSPLFKNIKFSKFNRQKVND